MDIVDRHLRLVERAEDSGAPVVFYLSATRVYNSDDTFTETAPAQTVHGHAIEIRGDPEEYAKLGSTLQDPVTLIFGPEVLGELPKVNSRVVWAGKERTVHSILPIRPSGVAIGAKVVLT